MCLSTDGFELYSPVGLSEHCLYPGVLRGGNLGHSLAERGEESHFTKPGFFIFFKSHNVRLGVALTENSVAARPAGRVRMTCLPQ